ncbi:MAG: hypothetical protein K0R83_1823 [Caulobacter sp.]|nr:hypothetical protein [Caulobacter sp.]
MQSIRARPEIGRRDGVTAATTVSSQTAPAMARAPHSSWRGGSPFLRRMTAMTPSRATITRPTTATAFSTDSAENTCSGLCRYSQKPVVTEFCARTKPTTATTQTISSRRLGISGPNGRTRAQRQRTRMYSVTVSKITGATKALNAPPTTPPIDMQR